MTHPLKIVVPEWEDWDPVKQRFLHGKETKLTLGHSLMSIAKWEVMHKKPYLTDQAKTAEEMLDYIKCMTISNPNGAITDETYRHLTMANMKEIEAYIADPMTATTFSRKNRKYGREIITSEQIYYSMAAYGIPFECQQWHFNRLMVLLEVAAVNNQPKSKMSKKDVFAQNKALNAARRAKAGSKG